VDPQLRPESVASYDEVTTRAHQAVRRVEERLGIQLDEETRQNIREDVLAIWRYYRPAGVLLEPQPGAAAKPRVHVVRPGEFLIKIAKKYYNDVNAWGRIYAANYCQIGPDPDRLRVGAKLVIPG
jgi:nucleoid-associated protein YgaU